MVASKDPAQITQSARFGSSGELVKQVQAALLKVGYDIGEPDGDFGRITLEAVMDFQRKMGSPDGVVGSNTASALEITLPPLSVAIPAPPLSGAVTASPTTPATAEEGEDDHIDEPRPSIDIVGTLAASTGPHVTDAAPDAKGHWWAIIDGGAPFYVGTSTNWSGYAGLYQPGSKFADIPGGTYDPADWASRLDADGPWAWFLLPTIIGESGGYWGRINTYDGAGLTFGIIQFASHTPDDNLVLLFRSLLAQADGARWFPDLTLDSKGKVAKIVSGKAESLETPNAAGRLGPFMNYLNPDAKSVGKTEAINAARLIGWQANDDTVKRAQLDLAIRRLKWKVNRLDKTYGVDLDKEPIYRCIWVADILHHGRGTYKQLRSAFESSDPDKALAAFGADSPKWKDRVSTVAAEISKLKADKRLDGEVWGKGAFAS